MKRARAVSQENKVEARPRRARHLPSLPPSLQVLLLSKACLESLLELINQTKLFLLFISTPELVEALEGKALKIGSRRDGRKSLAVELLISLL